MSTIVLDGLALAFGERVIFEDLGLRLSEQDRIGLIGPNGSGKTTLLRVLAGEQEADRGTVKRARGARIGYLPQELASLGSRALLDFVVSSVPGRDQLGAELADAEAALEQASADDDHDELMTLAARVADIHERIDHFERFYSEHEAMRILAGLGFATADHDRDLSEFSGGWQMRAALAGLLYQRPDVLLLDEPTNHLDLPSVAWFAEFLKRYKRCFVLISHDREFLNEQIDRVVSFEPEGVRSYAGNYDGYLAQRAEEAQILENKAANLARERERLQRFVDRFRAQANKAAAVQSRVKALEKMEDVELYQRRKVMRFSFPPCERAVGEVMVASKVRKAYGDNVVFPGVDLTVRRGEKIGIIGVNGAGKTTLLKMMAGELPPDSGKIRLGNKVTPGYYAQHHADTLHRDWTVYEEVQRANPDASIGRVRSILGAFLFSGDDVEKPVSVLSGCERARVALARLLVSPGNLLLMDEPTNHLDLLSSESLTESLASYDGTLLFVSHNRSLIRNLATVIWNVEDGAVEVYQGSLDEYMYSCRLRREALARDVRAPDDVRQPDTSPSVRQPDTSGEPRRDAKARKRRAAERRTRRNQRIKPIERRVGKLEERITKLEEVQKRRGAELSDPAVYDDAPRRDELLGAYQRDADKLEELTARWEAAQEELEAAVAEVEAAEAAEDAEPRTA